MTNEEFIFWVSNMMDVDHAMDHRALSHARKLIDLASQVDGLLSTAKRHTTKYRGEPDEDEWLISDDVLKELQKAYDELEGK
jgi:hypothetical protein